MANNTQKWGYPTGTKSYFAWRSMRRRCLDKKDRSYGRYGGRGILICQKWINNYAAFYEDMGNCPEGMTLDRINSNLDYLPENCRWANWETQENNRCINIYYDYGGEKLTLPQIARKIGIKSNTLWRRINIYNMPPEKAFNPNCMWKPFKHGTKNGYSTGCRCKECTEANTIYHRGQRAKRKMKESVKQ